MLLSELFRRLSYGELSNLSISGDGSGTLVSAKHPQIIQYTNEALLRIFSRFALKHNNLILEQVEHITHYHLIPLYAESKHPASGVSYPYIKDLRSEPFTGDVIQITEILDEFGCTIPYNDVGRGDSIFLTAPDTLQVLAPIQGSPIEVVYQASHIKLEDQGANALNQNVDIPIYLEGALQSFIGYKVYSHMNGAENQSKSQEYIQTYEMICSEIESKDLVNQTTSTTNNKLENRGWK